MTLTREGLVGIALAFAGAFSPAGCDWSRENLDKAAELHKKSREAIAEAAAMLGKLAEGIPNGDERGKCIVETAKLLAELQKANEAAFNRAKDCDDDELKTILDSTRGILEELRKSDVWKIIGTIVFEIEDSLDIDLVLNRAPGGSRTAFLVQPGSRIDVGLTTHSRVQSVAVTGAIDVDVTNAKEARTVELRGLDLGLRVPFFPLIPVTMRGDGGSQVLPISRARSSASSPEQWRARFDGAVRLDFLGNGRPWKIWTRLDLYFSDDFTTLFVATGGPVSARVVFPAPVVDSPYFGGLLPVGDRPDGASVFRLFNAKPGSPFEVYAALTLSPTPLPFDGLRWGLDQTTQLVVARGLTDADGGALVSLSPSAPMGKPEVFIQARVDTVDGPRSSIVLVATLPPAFRRGDPDADGRVGLSDSIATLLHLFVGPLQFGCLEAADYDDSGRIGLEDAVATLFWRFLGGIVPPAPPGPFECGFAPGDPDAGLGCESYWACR